jgi:hypothetical protein
LFATIWPGEERRQVDHRDRDRRDRGNEAERRPPTASARAGTEQHASDRMMGDSPGSTRGAEIHVGEPREDRSVGDG